MDIRENLTQLRAAVEDWPEEEFDLAEIKTACGSHYCALGIACTMPYFHALGLSLIGSSPVIGGHYPGSHDLDEMFGRLAWGRLFASRQLGGWDAELTRDTKEERDDSVSDKQLALARIDRQLVLY